MYTQYTMYVIYIDTCTQPTCSDTFPSFTGFSQLIHQATSLQATFQEFPNAAMAVLQPEDGVLDLFRAVDGLHKAYWRLGGIPGWVETWRLPMESLVNIAIAGI